MARTSCFGQLEGRYVTQFLYAWDMIFFIYVSIIMYLYLYFVFLSTWSVHEFNPTCFNNQTFIHAVSIISCKYRSMSIVHYLQSKLLNLTFGIFLAQPLTGVLVHCLAIQSDNTGCSGMTRKKYKFITRSILHTFFETRWRIFVETYTF